MPETGILVGAPHTSAWDWVAMLAISWANSRRPQVLIKSSYFNGPAGAILRHTGGIPLDRANPGDTIRALLAEAEKSDSFLLVIAAEGTRSKGEYWKPGFLRIAQQTGLPVTTGFIDGATRTLGLGPTFTPSGDVAANMQIVRAFYADKYGIHPKNRIEPRLREELTGLPEATTGTTQVG